jgi:hypothetical protein
MARRGRRTQWLSAALLAAGGTAVAATPAPLPAPSVTSTPAADAAAQAELLLYLSEFEDAQGEWVDPAELPPSAPSPPEEDDDAP